MSGEKTWAPRKLTGSVMKRRRANKSIPFTIPCLADAIGVGGVRKSLRLANRWVSQYRSVVRGLSDLWLRDLPETEAYLSPAARHLCSPTHQL